MADKKITTLSERLVPIIGEDLLLLVANVVPASATANYKIQVRNFMANSQITLPATAGSAYRFTANVVANSTAVQAAAEFKLDAGNNVIGSTNAYGALINHSIANNSWSRSKSPVAFLGLVENAGAAGNNTLYLLDAGLQGTANISGSNGVVNASAVFSKTADTGANRMVKCLINGETVWLLGTTTNPS
jgi:hypothetical protein